MKLTLDLEEVKQILLDHINTMFSTDFNEVVLDKALNSVTFEVKTPDEAQ